MRKQDKEKISERLDEIEALTSMPDKDGYAIEIGLPGIDGEVLDLMAKAAKRNGGAKLLVEKYAASRSVIIVSALCGVLGQYTKRTKLKDAYLIFEYIEMLERKDSPGILGGILSAIKEQIRLTRIWQKTKMPDNFYPFLQHCLEFTSRKAKWKHHGLSDWVEIGAVDLLWTMCEAGIYNFNFDEKQRGWIENKIREIAAANLDNETFQLNTSIYFRLCSK